MRRFLFAAIDRSPIATGFTTMSRPVILPGKPPFWRRAHRPVKWRSRHLATDVGAASTEGLEAIRVSTLGRRGRLTELMRGLGTLGPEARRAAGAALNVPAGMFQWTGGAINGGATGLNNVGAMTLAGPDLKYLYGVLNNAGTISHTARGLSSFATKSCNPELPTAFS